MSQPAEKAGASKMKLAIALIAAVGSISWAGYQYARTRTTLSPGAVAQRQRMRGPAATIKKTDDGRQLLWAKGPRDIKDGEWFDITDSPLDPKGYQFGIGKDSIPAIDRPVFVAIDQREQLGKHRIDDKTSVLGYVHNGQAKAYPIRILNRHELVNDKVGGKPVTVGW